MAAQGRSQFERDIAQLRREITKQFPNWDEVVERIAELRPTMLQVADALRRLDVVIKSQDYIPPDEDDAADFVLSVMGEDPGGP